MKHYYKTPVCEYLGRGSGCNHTFSTREKMMQTAQAVGQRPEVQQVRSENLTTEWTINRDARLAAMRTETAKQNRCEAANRRDGWTYNTNSALKQQKPCTMDGITIYPSRKLLIEALGCGKHGFNCPTFRYL